jgi:LmbE family N-acetylglucosaminyl deacetylase
MNIKSIVAKIIEDKMPCVFVSPHLDDAIFSAGELISLLAAKTKITIITIFTEGSNPPYTLSAKAFLKQCNYQDSLALFGARRLEDKAVCQELKINFLHLGLADASFRRKKRQSFAFKIFGNFIPELAYVYPIYRTGIISGKIAKEDEDNLFDIEKKLNEVKEKFKPGYVFCSLGVGNNVDHIITRDICQKLFSKLIFWEDYPYNLRIKNKKYISSKINLGSLDNFSYKKEKIKIMSLYESQIKAMFPCGITLGSEFYYANKSEANIEI